MLFLLDIELSYADWLGGDGLVFSHEVMGWGLEGGCELEKGPGFCEGVGLRGLNLLLEFGKMVLEMGALSFALVDLALIHGLSDFLARFSFSRAVPYFSSLDGHRRASAGWSWALLS